MSQRITLLEDVRACHHCTDLPLGPRPVLQFHPQARLLIASQAPGLRAHASGIAFDDASGQRLRDWLGLSPAVFYDAQQVAILPMGFCYPGKAGSGDAPPRVECAPLWRQQLLHELTQLQLTLAIGRYAQAWHLPGGGDSLTECVRRWQDFGPVIPLPHPSPLNNRWLAKNPWFEQEVLPALRLRVQKALA